MLEKFTPEERDLLYKRIVNIIELFGGKDDITSILRNKKLSFDDIYDLTDKWCYYKVNDITEEISKSKNRVHELGNRLKRQPSITVQLVQREK